MYTYSHLPLEPPLSPPPYHPSRSLQSTELSSVLYSRIPLAIGFTHNIVYVNPHLRVYTPVPTLHVHSSVLCICVSIAALQMGSSVPFLSRSHIYVLIYDTCVSLSDLLHSV